MTTLISIDQKVAEKARCWCGLNAGLTRQLESAHRRPKPTKDELENECLVSNHEKIAVVVWGKHSFLFTNRSFQPFHHHHWNFRLLVLRPCSDCVGYFKKSCQRNKPFENQTHQLFKLKVKQVPHLGGLSAASKWCTEQKRFFQVLLRSLVAYNCKSCLRIDRVNGDDGVFAKRRFLRQSECAGKGCFQNIEIQRRNRLSAILPRNGEPSSASQRKAGDFSLLRVIEWSLAIYKKRGKSNCWTYLQLAFHIGQKALLAARSCEGEPRRRLARKTDGALG